MPAVIVLWIGWIKPPTPPLAKDPLAENPPTIAATYAATRLSEKRKSKRVDIGSVARAITKVIFGDLSVANPIARPSRAVLIRAAV